MCLALIAINQHPLYRVIILSNRDEFYHRASTVADFWPDYPHVFAGKDLVANGTWLGVNQAGAFSFVTNYRNPNLYKPSLLSRGLLVKNYLIAKPAISPRAYIKQIATLSNQYNPFNLIIGQGSNIAYFSNRNNTTQTLVSGVYGISNHLLDTPWPKVLRAKQLFSTSLPPLKTCADPHLIQELLFPILEDKVFARDDELPSTGIPKDIEKSLSSIFVTIPDKDYGTRSSTIILLTENTLFFAEKTYGNAINSLNRIAIDLVK